MKKLLIAATIPSTIQAFFLPLTKHLRSQGWRVDAMANEISKNKECLQAFDCVWDVDWSRNPLEPKNLTTVPQQVRDIVTQQGYDIVNITTPVASFVTRFALNDLRKQGKIKVVYIAQGFYFYRNASTLRNSVFVALEKIAGLWTDYLVTVNREDEESAKQYHLVESERVRRIPGTGVDIERFSRNNVSEADIIRVRQELGIKPENPLFLSVAEFIPRKHPQDILKAFAQLKRPEAHLAFAGKGVILDDMRRLALKLGIQNQVHFLGFRRDVPALICASVATILASELEGLPNCVMESLCLETPVIGTDIRGTSDLLETGCGLLFKLGDVPALTKAMAWILDNPKTARMMGRQGRETIKSYGILPILKQYDALYDEVLPTQTLAVR